MDYLLYKLQLVVFSFKIYFGINVFELINDLSRIYVVIDTVPIVMVWSLAVVVHFLVTWVS